MRGGELAIKLLSTAVLEKEALGVKRMLGWDWN